MSEKHLYRLIVTWTGNKGTGTSGYRSYERSHMISAENKPVIYASSDPSFLGDKTKYNPEELLVASLSGCHMLWFLHLCADNGIVVTDYTDQPTGIMEESADGAGRFKEVILNPVVTVRNADMLDRLDDLHKEANKLCFIANSVNFPVRHRATGKADS